MYKLSFKDGGKETVAGVLHVISSVPHCDPVRKVLDSAPLIDEQRGIERQR